MKKWYCYTLLLGSMLSLLLLVFIATVKAEPGDLDTSFGSNGVVKTDLGDFDVAIDVAVQHDNKIVVTGSTFGALTNIALVRYESNGSIDSGFGTNGVVITNLSATDIGREVVIQANGKIVVGGSNDINGDKDFTLARYSEDGSLDTSFGVGGVVTPTISTDDDEIWGITLQSDGKIIAVGESGGQLAIARFNSDGSLDSTFDDDGIALPFAGSGQAVTVQVDGKIVVAGRTNSQFLVVRLNTDGSLDNSFDSDGYVMTLVGAGTFVSAYDVGLQSDGQIVVGGTGYNGSDYDIAVVRYNSDGSLDMNFGSNGKYMYDSGNGNDEGLALTIQSNDKILASGYSNTGFSAESFTLIRLQSDGTLDSSFSDDGLATVDSGQRANGMTIQPDNKILLAGYDGDFVTIRFEGDSYYSVYLPVVVK